LANCLLDGIDFLMSAPYLAQKFRFGHHAVAVPDEELKRSQGLGAKPDRLIGALQRTQVVVKPKSAEARYELFICPAGVGRHLVSEALGIIQLNFSNYSAYFQLGSRHNIL
jgi:hypothetical protein